MSLRETPQLQRTKRTLLRRYLWSLLGRAHPLFLDYPVVAKPRYGHGHPPHRQLYALIGERRDTYAERLRAFLTLREDFLRIERVPSNDASTAPGWLNRWMPPLDAVALYGFLCSNNPRRYFEIGSGHSTRIARRAITDHGLRTAVTSLDPHPRAEIDAICDRVLRLPLERADPALFDELEDGDILFIDGSHRVFTNSDATVAFLDVLPNLKPGVWVQFHDILLPYDYPPEWQDRYYSEQYLLAAYLLGGANQFEIVLPNAFVTKDRELSSILSSLWDAIGVPVEMAVGVSFWIQTR